MTTQQRRPMPSRSQTVVAWTVGGVTLVTAALIGACLHALVSTSAFLALGALGVAAVLGGVACWLLSRGGMLPLPHAASDSLCGSAQRLRLLESAVIHAHDAVVILEAQPQSGPGRSVLYVNAAFCRMTGYTRAEVVGRSLHFLRGPDSDPTTLDQIRNALNNSHPLRVELRNYRKDGTPFWVDLSLVPVLDADGRAAHWVMIQRDITEQRTAQDQLRRSEELFRGIFESAAAGVSLADPGGRFVSCNPAFAAMLGRSVEELLKLTPADVTHPEDWAAQQGLVASVRAGTLDRYRYSKRYLRPDGEVVWAELSYAAIRGPGGEFEYGLCVALNITEQHRLEEQLRQSQKMEAIGQMAGGVAHDFNNLLTGILGNLSLVELPPGDRNASLLAAAEQAAVRAAELTGKLLGYARRNQLMFAPVHPTEAFAEVLGLLGHTLDPRIQLTVQVGDACGPVQADPTLLTQALMNICLNARDSMPAGGSLCLSAEPVEVSVAEAAQHPSDAHPGSFIRLSIIDDGEGMTEEVKTRIFEPFFTTKEVGKGTGLGLPMVQGIIKQHHGWITCASTPGGGARFDLYLPPAATKPGTNPIYPLSHALQQQAPAEPVPTESHTAEEGAATILLVDDEQMIRDLGRTVLLTAGFQVLSAEDGIDAIEVFAREHERISLVILDVTMPRMSGRDAFRHLVEIDPAARILFSTGYSAEDIAELDGAVGLLHKPYRPNELLAAVRAVLDPQPAGAR